MYRSVIFCIKINLFLFFYIYVNKYNLIQKKLYVFVLNKIEQILPALAASIVKPCDLIILFILNFPEHNDAIHNAQSFEKSKLMQ